MFQANGDPEDTYHPPEATADVIVKHINHTIVQELAKCCTEAVCQVP